MLNGNKNVGLNFKFENKLLFLINFFFVFFMLLSFNFKIKYKYFFYINIIFTYLLSYYFFKKDKNFSKYLIITDIFILFYFASPYFLDFLSLFFDSESYYFLILYNLFLSLLFLYLSRDLKNLYKNFKETKLFILLFVIILSIIFGMTFYIFKEPVPKVLLTPKFNLNIYIILLLNSFLIALSEQTIFTVFLYNAYNKFTRSLFATIQTSILFSLFHALRILFLINYFKSNFNTPYLIVLLTYLLFLFVFEFTAIILYSFSSKKHKGNFIYPLIFHFLTDFILFVLLL